MVQCGVVGWIINEQPFQDISMDVQDRCCMTAKYVPKALDVQLFRAECIASPCHAFQTFRVGIET